MSSQNSQEMYKIQPKDQENYSRDRDAETQVKIQNLI